MKTTKNQLVIAASLLALGASVPAANAATIVWQGGTGSYSSANWTVNGTPNQNHPGNLGTVSGNTIHATTVSGGTVNSFNNALVNHFNVSDVTNRDTLTISGGAVINADFIQVARYIGGNGAQENGNGVGGAIIMQNGTINVTEANSFRSTVNFAGFINFTGAAGSASIVQTSNGTINTALAAKLSATALSYFAIDGTMVSTGITYNGSNLAAINAALATGGNVVGGRYFFITNTSGTQTLTLIPEPSAALLGGLGMLCLLRRRR